MTGKNFNDNKKTIHYEKNRQIVYSKRYSRMNSLRVTGLLLLLVLIFMISSVPALAEEPGFTLDIDTPVMEKGVSASLTLSIRNAKDAEIIQIEGIDDFDQISKSHSTSTRIINMDVSYQDDYHYIIMPKKVGTFSLKGKIKYKGKIYYTNEIEVRVNKSSTVNPEELKNLFVKTNLSDNEIYFGQKVILTYELYSRYNLEDFGFREDVNFDGFISTDIPQDKLNANYTYLNGNKYVKYEVKQSFLSATGTGKFSIPAFNFQANISTGSFFDSSRPVYLETDPEEIVVKPLPKENRPDNFSGIVGKLDLVYKFSRKELDYGDSLTLEVKTSGNCNLDGLQEIIPGKLPGFSVYQTEKKNEETLLNGKYHAEKDFEIILVPEKTGNLQIDDIEIPYFDVDSGTYQKAIIPATEIKVNGELLQSQNQTTGQNYNDRNAAGNESLKNTPLTETVIDQVNYQADSSEYFVVQIKRIHLLSGVIFFIVIIVIITLLLLLRSYRNKTDSKLLQIYKQINEVENTNEAYNLLNEMVKYKYNVSLKANPRTVVGEKIENTISRNLIFKIMDSMENRDDVEISVDDMKADIKKIYKLIK